MNDLFEGYNAKIARRQWVRDFARNRAPEFRSDFLPWLEENMAIWERFELEANLVYRTGRRRYSARTIGEFIRHETALRAKGDEPFKCSDWRWPDLARLWLLINPERVNFFETRESPQRRAAA